MTFLLFKTAAIMMGEVKVWISRCAQLLDYVKMRLQLRHKVNLDN